MRFIYSIFIALYGLVIRIISPFNKRAKAWQNGRKTASYTNILSLSDGKYIWIHCASAGEFEQAIPLIHSIKKSASANKIAVSFYSPSGYELYKNSLYADLFFYLPLDTYANAEKLIKKLNIAFVIFIHNERWWNLLHALHQHKIDIYLVNADIPNNISFFYKWYLNKTAVYFTKIFDVKTFGNTKLERVIENKNHIFNDEIIESFCNNAFTIILGSCYRKEIEFMATFFHKYSTQISSLKIILAPHEFDEKMLSYLKDIFSKSTEIISYTNIQNVLQQRILFLNKIGVLKYIYRFGNIAFIGGGFGKGIHNTSEAVVYGIPAIIGPNYHKSAEIFSLIKEGFVFPINSYEQFEQQLLNVYNNNLLQQKIRIQTVQYFSGSLHTADRILSEILK